MSLSGDLASDPPPPSSSSSSSSPWTSPLHHDSVAVDLFTTVNAGRPGAEAAGPRGGGGDGVGWRGGGRSRLSWVPDVSSSSGLSCDGSGFFFPPPVSARGRTVFV